MEIVVETLTETLRSEWFGMDLTKPTGGSIAWVTALWW